MSNNFPAHITVAAEDRLGQCEYIRRTLAEARVADLQRRIRELESINEGLLVAFDQFLRDEGYSDEEAGGFLYPWISKVKEQPR